MNRELSDSLMVHYSNRTHSVGPRLTKMPLVVFNGVSVQGLNFREKKIVRQLNVEFRLLYISGIQRNRARRRQT